MFKIKQLFAISFVLLALTSCREKTAKHDGYILSGTVKGLDKATISIIEYNFIDRGAELKIIDSIQMTNGIFTLKGKIEHADQVIIKIGNEFNSNFFLENSTISLDFDTAASNRGQLTASVNGSELDKILKLQELKLDSITNQEKFEILNTLRTEMTAAYNSKNEEKINAYKIKSESLSALVEERNNERKEFMLNYIKKYPESAVAPWILGFQFSEGRMSNEEMKEVYPIFKGAAKQTAMFKFYEKTYNDLFKNLREGSIAPDFKLNDVNGKAVTLSEIKGTYKLVDFWASWCAPCRASFPHLKELYKKYRKDGFEIVGIGTSDVEEKWRAAIKKDETPWLHLNDLDKESEWGIVARQYGVPFLPTTFLMDEHEKIILRNPSKEELDAKLIELFGR